MSIIQADVVIVGGGGAGLRAAISAASQCPHVTVAVLSKLHALRSNTVVAEGGAAAPCNEDTFESHFDDTMRAGEGLCEPAVVDYFVKHAAEALLDLDRFGCPWSRAASGYPAMRLFGGMSHPRTWFAGDKTGFHIQKTLYHQSLKHKNIHFFEDFFVCDLVAHEGAVCGALALNILRGELVQFRSSQVILATGGLGRLFRGSTNGGLATGEGMALAYQQGVPLRDMEFIQYHPTALVGSGILISEACRSEGGVLLNRCGERYLQHYGLGPSTPIRHPQKHQMELGPRDRLSQAFWHEQQKGNTATTESGQSCVYLDMRHVDPRILQKQLPFLCELTQRHLGLSPTMTVIPVRPAVHYSMGGIATNIRCETILSGLFAVGECASIGLHGANRLGSNSLTELLVFGTVAGIEAVKRQEEKKAHPTPRPADIEYAFSACVSARVRGIQSLINPKARSASVFSLRNRMELALASGCDIYRSQAQLQLALGEIVAVQGQAHQLALSDGSRILNFQLIAAIELQYGLSVAEVILRAALSRRESRGAHQRLEVQYTRSDDDRFRKHSLVLKRPAEALEVTYQPIEPHAAYRPPSA